MNENSEWMQMGEWVKIDERMKMGEWPALNINFISKII